MQRLDESGAPTGPEVEVSQTPDGDHYEPVVTALPDGGFVVAWTNSIPNAWTNSIPPEVNGYSYSTRAQIFDAAGERVGGDFFSDATRTADQFQPNLASLSDGRFVLSWEDIPPGTVIASAKSQIFAADGTALGPPITLNTMPDLTTTNARAVGLDSGGFVVAYKGVDFETGANRAVRLQRFDSSGTMLGEPFIAHPPGFADIGDDFGAPSIAALPDGRFVYVFVSDRNADGSFSGGSILAQIYGEDGNAIGPVLQVNTTGWWLGHPQVTALADGGFVVIWRNDIVFGPVMEEQLFSQFLGQAFAADGSRIGAEFAVSAVEGGQTLRWPTIAALDDGGIVVAWEGMGDIRANVFARSYAPDTVTGTEGPDRLEGGAGDSLVDGLAGNDTLFGGDGNDTLDGGEGRDRLDGGAGANTLQGGPGDDRYVIRSAGDVIDGEVGFSQGGGIDTVEAWISYTLPRNVEILRLQGDADLNGTGNAAPEALVGNTGRNRLEGGGGNDVLNGKAGDDTLVGGTGADSLVGEGGADVFVFTAVADSRPGQANRDFINGFERGIDRIDLSLIDANSGTGDNDAFTFIGSAAFSGVAGQLRFFTFGGGNFNIVEADVNGDRVADMQIFVNLTNVMLESDFIL